MPVKSNCGAGRYFDHAVVWQKEFLEVTNSKFVVRISIPNNFNNTLSTVSYNPSLFNWHFVHSTISRSCFGGNMRRKNPSATYLVLLSCCAWEPILHQPYSECSTLAVVHCHSMVGHQLQPWPTQCH
jgi:hypothetical protein